MIIVKAGGSAITDKSTDFSPRLQIMESVASQLSETDRKVILVHGGGSYGHPLAAEFELHKGFKDAAQLPGVSQTRYSMTELNLLMISWLLRKGVAAVSIQPSACFVCTNRRISQSFLKPITRLLELGCLPVLYGDVVCDSQIGFCILSGDQIVSYLTEKLQPEKVIFGLEVDGLYTDDPKQEGTDLVREIAFSDLESISGKETGDVTRGMKGKLAEIQKMAGTEVNLINLLKEGLLLKAIEGAVEGTVIR